MAALVQDIRHTLRQWRRAPGFVVMALLTVTVGVGGTTTVMSVTDAVLLRALPGIRDPEELVEIRLGDRAGRNRRPMSLNTFQALRDAGSGLSGLAAAGYSEVSFHGGGEEPAEITAAMSVSGSYFPVLGVRPALGRFFTREETGAGNGSPTAVLSHSFWVRRFQGDPGVLGRTVIVNRQPLTVIGVAEEGFSGHLPLRDFSLWVPLAMTETLTGRSLSESRLLTIGRMAPGSSLARVRTATEGLATELRSVHPAEWASTLFVVEPHARAYQEFRGPITLFLGFLLALSGCILFVASSNLAGVLLARASARSHEVAVRLAVGASRRRLMAQFLTETLLLFLVGGGGGFLLASWATHALGKIPVPRELPLAGDFGPDLGVLALSMGVVTLAGIAVGLAPALRATRTDLLPLLRDERGGAPARQRLRKLFVVIQVTGAVALLGGSGVLFRALQRAVEMELGFEPEGVHVATVNLGIQQYSDEEGRIFLRRLLEEASALPGVEGASLADFVFLVSPPERSAVLSTPEGDGRLEAGLLGASPEFFQTMGVEITAGRPFRASDGAGGEEVAVVNELVARTLWPGQSVVGKTLRTGDASLRVVGVAEDSKYFSVGESPLAAVFLPQSQHYLPRTSLLLRMNGERRSVGRELQGLVRRLDPQIPLSRNQSYESLVKVHFLPRRLAAAFAGILGIMGLFLASVGIYGVLSATVSQRAPELAVRMALGAAPSALRRPVILGGMGLVLLGLILGLPLSLALTNLIRLFLYGMDPVDPVTLGSLVVVFALVGLAASSVPALKATRTDPAQVLRRS